MSALLVLPGCFSVRSTPDFSYEKLGPAEYAAMLKGNADHIIIDVRTPAEHRKSHLHGAVNYSYFSLKFGRMVEHLDRNELVFLYCETGHRSPLAARRMKRKGFRRVVDMKGGHARWRKTNRQR
ncbi:MAG: rhodanese-like domain-containing protein [Flavobacteriales bacterium]|nr:MAG: rhodanese-like domain-containing protein [Flavobacteriales bacterium]